MDLQTPPTQKEIAALERLIEIARRDTGQSRKVASMLLAWYNARAYGGFDLTDLWGVDEDINADMMRVLGYVGRCRHYPDSLGFDEDFQTIARLWRQPA
jgi:hypothetical protein